MGSDIATGPGIVQPANEGEFNDRSDVHKSTPIQAQTKSTARKADKVESVSQWLHNTVELAAGKEAKKPAQQAVRPPSIKLSAEAQRLCRIADEMLGHMIEVEGQMTEFKGYIASQKDEGKPLYRWVMYHGYSAISQALRSLDDAMDKFDEVHLPEEHVKLYRRRARQLSTSISHSVAFALGVMNEKSATCIDEIEESDMSPEGKSNANTLIIGEIKKVVKYSTRAAGHTWAALDLLEESLLIDELDQNQSVAIMKEFISESEHRQHASRKGWCRTAATLVLSTAASAAIGFAAAHLYGSAVSDMALKSSGTNNGMYTQVLDLVHRTQAVTNLTGEIYSIKLQDLDQRYKELEAASESHGLRIDNLVEALGPPNEEGAYYSSTSQPDCQVPDDIRHHVQKITENTERQSQRLHHEMEQMRKNMNRMDIRLTKRLDKVDRYGM